MRPYLHAVSSADALGGQWQDYLAIHEFLDSTKVACSDIRHRMILHSVDFGAALARMLFPDRGDIDLIVRQHVFEDIGEARTLSDWLQFCRRTHLPRFHPTTLPIDAERMVIDETLCSGIRDDTRVRQVCALLMLPMTFAPAFGPDALCVLGNSFGPALVRRIIGPPIEIDGTIFDPALCAERMIYGFYRAVPSMTAIVHTLQSSNQSEARE
jgi:hypothetical protein